MKNKINTYINKQSIIALAVLWGGGIILFVYSYFILDYGFTNGQVQKNIFINNPFIDNNMDTSKISNNSDSGIIGKDAYIFVNVNKKHFLTKFVSILPEENINSEVIQKPSTTVVERIKKKYSKTISKPSDFSIKPAPDL